MPPLHNDAIGYVRDLASEENAEWFRYICDAAIERTDATLTRQDTDNLYPLFIGRASYMSQTVAPVSPGAGVTPIVDFLEALNGFSCFKRLGPTLTLSFTKRVTVVFGTNGSGKSSLCEALRALADAAASPRPLHNVTQSPPGTPSFAYKLRNSPSTTTWNPSTGYGACANAIKYYDSSLATRSLFENVDPGAVISIAPFHLTVFGRLQEMTTQFRDYLQTRKDTNLQALQKDLSEVRELFKRFPDSTLAYLTEATARYLDTEIDGAEKFDGLERLAELRKQIGDLEKGLSEEGIKALKGEVRELAEISKLLTGFIVCLQNLWHFDVPDIDAQIEAKAIARRELERVVVGDGRASEAFSSFLGYAAERCDMQHPEGKTCPLCRQALEVDAQELFKNYHEYVSGEVAEQIRKLREIGRQAAGYSVALSEFDSAVLADIGVLERTKLDRLTELWGLMVPFSQIGVAPTAEAISDLDSMKAECAEVGSLFAAKFETLNTLASGRDETEKALKRLRDEAGPLEILEICSANLEKVKTLQKRANADHVWSEKIGEFPSLLRRVTTKSKAAHEDLIVSDFEKRLDGEYRTLTNKGMADFGVALRRQGRESTVTLKPNISGTDLAAVLSEGEQRVHSLALFFAELETCKQSVIVFDDPVSSFDYNYIASYCRRLRDYLRSHADRQVVVLTHNWEFFVQIQVTLNKAGLNNFLSVQVLENCATSAEYSEKVDELKGTIDGILASPSEPSREQKETLAGSMRRLIEAVVNTHVFANQRHQYKQKTLEVSAFAKFTKLVALELAEAQELSDLYSDLSITEHDDPRNAYVNTDRATFVARYARIKAIETAVVSRKIP